MLNEMFGKSPDKLSLIMIIYSTQAAYLKKTKLQLVEEFKDVHSRRIQEC